MLALLRSLAVSLGTKLKRKGRKIQTLKQHVQGLSTHLGDELIGIVVLEVLVVLGRQAIQCIQVLFFGQELQAGKRISIRVRGKSRLNDDVALVVDDHVELLGRDSEQVADFVRKRTEVPNVRNRNHEADMAYALTANFLLGYLYATTVAHDTLVANAFILSARTFKVLYRTKNALTEQTVTLGLVGPVVDGLWLQDFSARLLEQELWRRQANGDLIEATCRSLFVLSHVLVNSS